MSHVVRRNIFIATILAVVGLAIFAVTMTVLKWDFEKLSWGDKTMTTYEISESFNSITILEETTDIQILPSEDETAHISYTQKKNYTQTVTVFDGTLRIEIADTRRWYERIFNFTSHKVVLYLPKGEYEGLTVNADTGDIDVASAFAFSSIDIVADTGDIRCLASSSGSIKIQTSTGEITLSNLVADTIALTTTTGDIELTNIECQSSVTLLVNTGDIKLSSVRCEDLLSRGDTGDIELRDVIAQGAFKIERDTGDVELDGSDATEIFIQTDTGDVEGSLLSEKIFLVRSNTGKISVPKSVNGGRCEIETDTGDIIIFVKGGETT